MLITALILALILLVWLASQVEPTGRDSSLDWHAANGKWRVIYPDGARSQRFTRAVAEDYQKMFGGSVVPA